MPQLEPEQRALLTLVLSSGLGPILINRSVEALGSPQAVVEASIESLQVIEGIGLQRAQRIRASLDSLADGRRVDQEIELLDQHGVHVIGINEPEYPALLRHIPDPPPLLFVRGSLKKEDGLGLGVVGARRCTSYGREQAQRLSASASEAGLTVISGGARGIDGACHQAALRTNGRTVAVLGSGLARLYPPEHVNLFDEIAGDTPETSRGAVISEFPMTTPPSGENFPKRNRIISGLSLGVLVVEAATRSGALITARLAAEEHHREVMAVPGRIDSPASAGCHKIIREGWAQLVTSGAEILACLGETGAMLQAAVDEEEDAREAADREVVQAAAAPQSSQQQMSFNDPAALRSVAASALVKPPTRANIATLRLTPSQQQLVTHLKQQPSQLDELPEATGLTVDVIQADLTILEVRGVVRRDGNRFTIWR